MKTEYKGFTIEYSEGNNKWALRENYSKKYNSLTEAKEYIDKILKRDFAKFGVIFQVSGKYKYATVTSATEGGEYWVTYEQDGKNIRRKASGRFELFLLNKSNEDIIKKASDLARQIEEINKVREGELKKLQRLE